MDYLILLKSSAVLALFFFSYQLLLKNENYFKLNRFYLLIGIVCTILVPLISITTIVWVGAPSFTPEEVLPIIPEQINELVSETPTEKFTIDWSLVFSIIYSLGILFFSFRFIIQLLSVKKQIVNGVKHKQSGICFINNSQNKSPFSFFNTVVYNKEQFSSQELNTILTHEKAHCKQWHSIDIILSQLLCIFQWFNPLVWKYKKDIQNNLEFLADEATVNQSINTKAYQYLLVKTSVSSEQFCSITHHFNQSLIKKRINMLNNKNKSRNYWKTTLIVPLIIGFIYSCNQKTETRVKELASSDIHKISLTNVSQPIHKDSVIAFIQPIHSSDLERIGSAYGMRKNPITDKKKKHLGIDYTAPRGTAVYASSNGIINFSTSNGDYGNTIKIKHNNGYETRYCHLNSLLVNKGDKVSIGQKIATVGVTGLTTGPHLHFEVLKDGKHIDPNSIVPKPEQNNFPFIIRKETSLNKLKQIESNFNTKYDTQIKFSDIKYNDGKLAGYSFATKFKGNDEFNKAFTIKNKNNTLIKDVAFTYLSDLEQFTAVEQNGFQIKIEKDKTINFTPEDTSNSISLGKKPICVINGKVYTPEELNKMNLLNRIASGGPIKQLPPKEAIKKYGEIAKDGAIVFEGEAILIKKQDLAPTDSNSNK